MDSSTGKRIACVVQYDGTHFNGWQIQNKGRTVQGDIEGALNVLTREDIRITASGRTDAGVHGAGQVIHFDIKKELPIRRICGGLNGILPKDVSIVNVYHVPSEFHARYDAVEREYRYYIYNNHCRSPFMIHRAMWIKEKLSIDYLEEVGGYCIGQRDFASFCKKSESTDINTVRTIKEISFKLSGDIIEITIKGNAFLHNMIRIMVGTFVEMHKEKRDPKEIEMILHKKDREYSGKTASSCGLYLHSVLYSPHLDSMESAF